MSNWKQIAQTYGLSLLLVAGTTTMLSLTMSPAGAGELLTLAEANSAFGGSCGHACEDCVTLPDTCADVGVEDCYGVGWECTILGTNAAKGSGTVGQSCTTGALSGGCGEEQRYKCLDGTDSCGCATDPPNWICEQTESGDFWYTYEKDPC